ARNAHAALRDGEGGEAPRPPVRAVTAESIAATPCRVQPCSVRIFEAAKAPSGGAPAYQSRPNQRLIRLDPNSALSAARAADGPMSSPDRWSPKKVTSTMATWPAPNSR